MLKIYTGITQLKVKTDNLETLPNNICEDLSVGDVVILVDGGEEYTYVVSFKLDKDTLCFTNTNAEEVEEVSYGYGESGWEYDKTTTTPLGGGGTKLYFHTISFKYKNNLKHDFKMISHEGTSITSLALRQQINYKPLNTPQIHVNGQSTDISGTYLFDVSGANFNSIMLELHGIKNSNDVMSLVNVSNADITEIEDVVEEL